MANNPCRVSSRVNIGASFISYIFVTGLTININSNNLWAITTLVVVWKSQLSSFEMILFSLFLSVMICGLVKWGRKTLANFNRIFLIENLHIKQDFNDF